MKIKSAITAGVIASSLLLIGTGIAPAALGASVVAASAGWLSAPSTAVVGTTQQVSVTLQDGAGVTPGTFVQFAANGVTFGSAPVLFTGTGWTATTYWTPTQQGTFVLSGMWSGGMTNTVTTVVTGVGTTTTVTSPSWASVGTWVPVTVTVASTSGTFTPSGSVMLTGTGGYQQILTLSPSSGATATASTSYYAAAPGTVQLQATYQPAPGGAGASVSQPDILTIGSPAAAVSVTTPGQLYAGVPSPVTVTAGGITGSLTLTANGAIIAAGVAFGPGGYTTTVTPATPGPYSIVATVYPSYGSVLTGVDTTTVLTAGAPDVITVTADGSAPWVPGVPIPTDNGASIDLTAGTSSGAPVSFTVAGACTLTDPTVVQVLAGTGSCTVTAGSPGGNGRGPASAVYTLALQPGDQTAGKVNPKPSGSYPKGKVITLASTTAVTNTGQMVSWSVSSPNTCTLLQSKGKWKVRLSKDAKKTCVVTGTAPGIPGQWNAYVVSRNYRTK